MLNKLKRRQLGKIIATSSILTILGNRVNKGLAQRPSDIDSSPRQAKFQELLTAINEGNLASVRDYTDDTPILYERDESGRTALIVASGLGKSDIVEVLLTGGADANTGDSVIGATSLHSAAQNGDVKTAQLLLDYGAYLNQQAPSHGITPLMNASWHQNLEMVDFLLQQPRINVMLSSNFGATAMDLAQADMEGSPKAAKQIQELFEDYIAKLEQQKLPLIETVTNSSLSEAEMLQKVEQLITEGSNVNEIAPVTGSNHDGHTPLLIAARDGYTSVVKILLENGADITLEGEHMQAHPAHKAAYNGHTDILRLLIAHPDFDQIKDAKGAYNGYTAIHDAIWHGHVESTKVLMEAGANTEIVAFDGLTPLALAQKNGYREIVSLLQN